MANIYLTSGNDVFVYASGLPWENIYGREGNDQITINGNANIVGEAGDDVFINTWAGNGTPGGGIAFWNSPQAITVDLQAGYALDGFGGRDTLRGRFEVSSSGRDGDKVFGSSLPDRLWMNGWGWGNRNGAQSALVDGRDGRDEVAFSDVNTPWTRSVSNPGSAQLSFSVSSDGRKVTVSQTQGAGSYTLTCLNVETLRFEIKASDGGQNQRIYKLVADLIDFSKVGSETLLLDGQRGWSGGNVSYSFMTAAPGYGGGDGGAGFTAPTAEYQSAVRSILSQLGGQIGVTFTEVADTVSAYGQLRFGANQQSATKGYSFIPGTVPDDRAGDVWLDLETLSVLQPGQEGWQVLLHEIGHAMGLSHPIAEGTATEATVLLNKWNHNGYTVMSPNQAGSGLWQSWFAPLDMQALGQLYGSKAASANSGNDTYRLANSQGFSLSSLRDSAGSDTLDASGLTLGAYIDLTPGSYTSAGYTLRGTASVDNLFIDPGTTIERAVGTPFDDVLIGNAADNLFWPGKGNDWIDGKAGINTVLYDSPRSAHAVQRLSDGSGAWVVADAAGAGGSDTLLNVSRVYFGDSRLAPGRGWPRGRGRAHHRHRVRPQGPQRSRIGRHRAAAARCSSSRLERLRQRLGFAAVCSARRRQR